MSKLLLVSFLIELLCLFATVEIDTDFGVIFLSIGFIYFFVMYSKYRNSGARHYHELETKTKMENLRKVDNYLQRRKGLSNSKMRGANNRDVDGTSVKGSIFDNFNDQIMK